MQWTNSQGVSKKRLPMLVSVRRAGTDSRSIDKPIVMNDSGNVKRNKQDARVGRVGGVGSRRISGKGIFLLGPLALSLLVDKTPISRGRFKRQSWSLAGGLGLVAGVPRSVVGYIVASRICLGQTFLSWPGENPSSIQNRASGLFSYGEKRTLAPGDTKC